MAQKNNTNQYLFHHGTHFTAYRYMGVHKKISQDGAVNTVFRVWAPHADKVFVTFDPVYGTGSVEMSKLNENGLWQVQINKDLFQRNCLKYKYLIVNGGKMVYVPDPYALYSDCSDDRSSIIFDIDNFIWTDDLWMSSRENVFGADKPVCIYDVDPGTFCRNSDGSFIGYKKLGERLALYLNKLGYNYIRMPIYSFDNGYDNISQCLFSPDIRSGNPDELRSFINKLHRFSIGVIVSLDIDGFSAYNESLCRFDGDCLYEVKQKYLPDEYRLFNYIIPEVRSFALSNVYYFLNELHIDGICFNCKNIFKNENDNSYTVNDLLSLTKQSNRLISDKYPDVFTLSDGIPAKYAVTKPLHLNGIGMDLKSYNYRSSGFDTVKGLMKGTLSGKFTENEVICIDRSHIPGDTFFSDNSEKYSYFRAFSLLSYCIPGKKLISSGCESGIFSGSGILNRNIAADPLCSAMLIFSSDLNHFYKNAPELWESDGSWQGFRPLYTDDFSTAFARFSKNGSFVICVFNLSSAERTITFGVPSPGFYSEIFKSDLPAYGGCGSSSLPVRAKNIPSDIYENSLTLTVPAYSGSVYKSESLLRTYRK